MSNPAVVTPDEVIYVEALIERIRERRQGLDRLNVHVCDVAINSLSFVAWAGRDWPRWPQQLDEPRR